MVMRTKNLVHLNEKVSLNGVKIFMQDDLLSIFSCFEGIGEPVKPRRPIVFLDGHQVEVEIDVKEVSLQPRLEMVVNEVGRRVVHALQMDGNNGQMTGEDGRPVLPPRSGGF